MRTEIFAVFVFQVRVCERVTEKDRYIEKERKREQEIQSSNVSHCLNSASQGEHSH